MESQKLASEKVLSSKAGQKALEKGINNTEKNMSPGKGLFNKSEKPDSEKSIDEKSDEKEQKKISSVKLILNSV